MTSNEACDLLGISTDAFYALAKKKNIRLLRKRSGWIDQNDYSAEDILALVDSDEVQAIKEKSERFGDDYKPVAPLVRTHRVSITTPDVDEAYYSFVSAVAAACSSAGLTRAQAEARMNQLLGLLWDATEPLIGKLPGEKAPRAIRKCRARAPERARAA